MDLIASLPTEIVELPPPCGEGEREKKEEEKEEEEEGEGERDRKGERDEGESKEKDRESVVMEQEDTPLKRKTRSVTFRSVVGSLTSTPLAGLRQCLLREILPCEPPPPRSPRRVVEGRG